MNHRSRFIGSALLAVLPALTSAQQVAGQEPYAVVHGWPQLPTDSVFGQISGVGVDSHNHVFAFNRAEKGIMAIMIAPTILCFDGASGKLVSSWGAFRFQGPHGLRVDRDDNVWTTDGELHQVFKFSHDGKLLLALGSERVPGSDRTHFSAPTDVAFGPDGSVYVADGYGNSRIVKFSADGKFLLEWGRRGEGPSEFSVPHGITVDREGRVYVADRNNARVQVFDANGKFLHMWTAKDFDMGRPWAVTIGPDNLLYVVDGGNDQQGNKWRDREQLLKVDLSGKVLARWSRFGRYDGQIYGGHAVGVGSDGAVYVGDVLQGARVQKFVPRTQ